ncbi:hypothetical protein RXV86_03195 [Alisedimentitalea sp. MJ-SS2]|uniref:hypothetical protein n=1 Tax=Aliisedimentitalea sp. MJ-SS2 TaxID=3049795 RepID=UPI0029141D7E|nr:hypothetical protein [Alisedimentitalea sp. MJ-SS2]MDU8926382.1 hypothetical protein [Alisedimentitalea sp. MJ-SS2]
MEYLGYLFLALNALFIGAVLYAWWQKFVRNRPDRYGKGPGHDLRGMERGQTGFIRETPAKKTK